MGIERRDSLPFNILNTFGVLSCKAEVEELLADAARERGFEAVFVRPGRLIGEPFTNPDMATAMQLAPKANEFGAKLRLGDEDAGDCARGTCAEALCQALRQEKAGGKAFTVINTKGEQPTQAEWDSAYDALASM